VLLKANGERAHLAVEDDGVGHESEASSGRAQGLGRMIVKAMATKLNAEWGQDEKHHGMRVTMAFDRQQNPTIPG
jgi:two-component sensor histidine kinase